MRPVGIVRSELRELAAAPRQGSAGAPDAWLIVDPAYAENGRLTIAGSESGALTLAEERKSDDWSRDQ